MRTARRSMLLALSAALLCAQSPAQMDPANPSCPRSPDWSANKTMTLKVVKKGSAQVLLAEGPIDQTLPDRLKKALSDNPDIAEIWLRSPGGNARAGNAAGRLIRGNPGLVTRIPAGWTCFSACNFVFMGGQLRVVEPGGNFMVHMFTMTNDRAAIDQSVALGTDTTVELIGDIEQESALLASEDNDFLIRMGVSRKLLTDIMYKQKAVASGGGDQSTRRCLTQDEVFQYNVANVRE
ncbi:hypothetical protein [Blastomonas fulva]|uniref:COG3904 family protein n=1 Tax=Blastomonas fulva TaxID=1550728 RepID=UPI0025A31B57|nr:hypothetical protein [Blastomonas fulva]MDM7929339.1 hypothetical protein [Blastomonas fulva]MDM7967799.1 hypothetical protein [Blastomonas fulva]